LSALVAIWMFGLGFLGPLIVWLIKKDEMRFVDDQGKEALNFQINVLLLTVVMGMIAFPLIFLTLGLGVFLLVPLALVLGAVAIVMPILAAIKSNSGETYRYPYILRLVK
jgi:uncharacterized Tic20 family protein